MGISKRKPTDFDDLDIELIQDLIRIFSTIIGIPRQVTLLDTDQWIEYYEDISTKKKKKEVLNGFKAIYGQAMPSDRVIWLNSTLCKREYGVLIATIIHELLHIKYPKLKEDRIQEIERQLTGRYDYKRAPVDIKSRIDGDVSCLKVQEQ